MIPQKSPNSWSCLLTAFSIALQVPIENLINMIGHDGSEVTHAGLPEPLNRRGFHPQELIKVCLEQNLSATYIEMIPLSVPKYSSNVYYQPRIFDTGNWNWFRKNLFSTNGVIECRTAVGSGHAMAYEGQKIYADIYDPSGGKEFQLYTLEDAEQRDRFFVALWRLDKI